MLNAKRSVRLAPLRRRLSRLQELLNAVTAYSKQSSPLRCGRSGETVDVPHYRAFSERELGSSWSVYSLTLRPSVILCANSTIQFGH